MSVLAVNGLGSASASSQKRKAISQIGGMMDFSRQYAIAHDTYTYASFSQTGEILTIAVFASRTGRELFTSTSAYPNNSSDINVIAPPKEITQMTLAPTGSDYGGWTPPDPPAPAVGLNRSWSITSNTKTFDGIVAFTPTGAASVTVGGLDEVIQFGILPLNGNGKQGFALRLSGLTGINRILQP